MADNDAHDTGSTRMKLRLVKTRHRLSRRATNTTARQSTNLWTLHDGTIVGLPDLDQRHAARVFAIALSVQSWRFLHSPVIISTVSELDLGRIPPLTTQMTSPRVLLDVDRFAAAAEGLTSVWTMDGPRGEILREALNSYWDALHSVHRRARILNLWAAFEKAVNDDGERRTGRNFDRHASEATTWEKTEIHRLRDLTRWLKHPDVIAELPDGVRENIPVDAGRIKRLTDLALADRLEFDLSAAYDE